MAAVSAERQIKHLGDLLLGGGGVKGVGLLASSGGTTLVAPAIALVVPLAALVRAGGVGG